jgi:hypothetical protein
VNYSRANVDDHTGEYMGSALHQIWPSEISNDGDPAAQGVWYPTWALDHRAALLAALEPGVTLRFGPAAMTQYLHAAHAEEAVGFNDRRRSAGGEGRREGPGRERHRKA